MRAALLCAGNRDHAGCGRLQAQEAEKNALSRLCSGTSRNHGCKLQDRAARCIAYRRLEGDGDFRSVPVRPDGKISLPLLNDVQAAGLTAMELAGNASPRA